ncbi:MAG: hypothetical protein M3Y65_02070 [Pseudomonadota bacterium]|nr:hypothetical protein [Pseudomonadota bacterium]
MLLLEKLAPAIEQVDSSSGRIGSTVNQVIVTLVPIIAKADVSAAVRATWLERLWAAYEADTMPSIEYLGDFWGELCVTKELARQWANRLTQEAAAMWENNAADGKFTYFKGTQAGFSALYATGDHDELFALIATSEYREPSWNYREWGARALAASGKMREAIAYAEGAKKSFNPPVIAIARFCEQILLESGFVDEAYAGYALDAASASTNAGMFNGVVKKYPQIPRETILRDLVARDVGREGKWFVPAKDAGLYDLAIALANKSSCDPRTLTRAAVDFVDKAPEFALAAGMTSLRSIALGWGYEITGEHVREAYGAILKAAEIAGVSKAAVVADVRVLVAENGKGGAFVERALGTALNG